MAQASLTLTPIVGAAQSGLNGGRPLVLSCDANSTTFWYKTAGQYNIQGPPTEVADAKPATLFLHIDTRDNSVKVWVKETDGRWVVGSPGYDSPRNDERKLWIRKDSGSASWVKPHTYITYLGQEKKNATRRSMSPVV